MAGVSRVLADNAVTTAKLATVPACRVRRNASQSIASATYTFVSFDTEVFDTNGMFTATDTKVTIQTAGIYLLTASVAFPDATGGDPVNVLIFEKNAATANTGTALGKSQGLYPQATLDSCIWNVSTTASLAASDTVKLTIYSGSGSSHNFGGAADWNLAMSVTWIGKAA
jgi:hypothetical protein